MSLVDLINNKKNMSPAEKIKVGSYFYKYSENELFLTDGEYKEEMDKLSATNPLRYLRWEQVDIFYPTVKKFLDMFNVPDPKCVSQPEQTTDRFDYLRSLFPTPASMQMQSELDPIFELYLPQLLEVAIAKGSNTIEVMLSYKEDGWKIKEYFSKDSNKKNLDSGESNVEYAHTRGRYTNNITECTRLLEKLSPRVEVNDDFVYSIEGELMVKKSGLEKLRVKYPDKKLNNVRNSVTSFTHGTVDVETDYDCAEYVAYSIMREDGVRLFEQASDMYNYLKALGFNVPHYKVITVDISNLEIDDAMMKLCESVYEAFEYMEDYYTDVYGKEHECDGVVIQPNLISWNKELVQTAAGNFTDGLLAIKAGIWSNKVYTSTVEEIYYTDARRRKSVMLRVKPVRSNLGQNMTKVDVGYLYLGSKFDIRIGDTVAFTSHSQQNIKFLKNISHEQRQS